MLVVQAMAELVALRGQVALVLGLRRDLDRNLLDDLEAEAVDARELPWGCS